MNTSILDAVGETLRRAFPELINVPWDKYGESIQLVDAAGVKKYQDMMLVCQLKSSIWMFSATIGILPDSMKSWRTVEAKIQALRDHPEGWSSIEFRDPPRVWGGAVQNDVGDYWGLTGLPEIGDHLVMTHLLFYNERVCTRRRELLLGHDHPGVSAALQHVGMSVDNYEKLVRLTNDIIAAAA